MLARMPELAAQSIAFSQNRMTALAPKIQALVDEFQRSTM
jgi:hypothetical protein